MLENEIWKSGRNLPLTFGSERIKRRYKYAQHIQTKARMDELEEDLNGLQLCFFKTCLANSFSKFIYVVCDDWSNDWET